jgi:predicted lipoprotein with Yx(FWY)xxD motif
MKRTYLCSAVVLASAVGVSAVASANDGEPTARAARTAKVQLRRTSVGKILVDGSGFTLFRFTRDARNKNACVKISGCSAIWPAFSTTGKPTAGQGVKASLLSTIKLPSGRRQVTYAGDPLYRYAEASEAGETVYVGAEQFGGKWYAVNAAGKAVK